LTCSGLAEECLRTQRRAAQSRLRGSEDLAGAESGKMWYLMWIRIHIIIHI
jgi:hypothetical protein